MMYYLRSLGAPDVQFLTLDLAKAALTQMVSMHTAEKSVPVAMDDRGVWTFGGESVWIADDIGKIYPIP